MKLKVEYRVEWNELAREVTALLRQAIDAHALEEKLGDKRALLKKLENPDFNLNWSDFLALCRALDKVPNFDFQKRFITHELDDYATIITSLMLGTPQVAFCKRIGISRTMLNKWLAKTAVPTLANMLHLMHDGHGMMISWLTTIMDVEKLEHIKPLVTMQLGRARILKKHPIAIYILMVIYTKQFETLEYSSGYFARLFNIAPEVEQEIIQAFIDCGTLVPWQKSFAVVECFEYIVADFITTEERLRKDAYSLSFIQNQLQQFGFNQGENIFINTLCCITKRQKEEISQILFETHRKILNVMINVDDETEVIDDAIAITLNMVSYLKNQHPH